MKRALGVLAAACALTIAGCGGHPTVGHGYHTPYGLQAHAPEFGKHPAGVPMPAPLSPTAAASTYLMLDSVDTSVFSSLTPPAVAGYLPPSSWPTFSPFLTQFPHAYHVAVDVQSFVFGDRRAAISCLDDEPGDATISEAGPWVVNEVHHGFRRPCVYGSLSAIPAIRANVTSHYRGRVFYWCADWTDFAHLDVGCDAVQWTNHYLGRNIDASTATAAFLNVTQSKPKPQIRCWAKGWQHAPSCKSIRSQAYAKHAALNKQLGYLKVSSSNAKHLQAQSAPLQKRLVQIDARAVVELRGHHYSELRVSAQDALNIETRLVPLNQKLGPIQARVKAEQAKVTALRAQLAAIYKEGGR